MKPIVSDIIGREKEINDLRIILEHCSVVISSVRRMGKTMILTKMDEISSYGQKSMLCFVESVQTAEEFVNVIRERLIEQGLIKKNDFKKVLDWLNHNLGNKDFGYFKTPEFTRHWKVIFNLIIDDLISKHKDRVILMLDEFPKMLWNLISNGNHIQAEEILDELRTIREKYEKRSGLRFIYCGSVGMNLVINYLKKEHRYSGAPLNNMHHYIVQEMSPSDAEALIRHLSKKNQMHISDISHLAKATSYLPFFIDRIFTQLKLNAQSNSVSNEVIDKTISEFVSAREHNNQFGHFTERIDTYYADKEKKWLMNSCVFYVKVRNQSRPINLSTL
ncbi:MAG: hypothetical protein NT175_03870 [Bacteroidetes bacterium]|nr:hypothetical protein [Bacteroidota bacterium]